MRQFILFFCLAVVALSQDPGLPKDDPTVSYWQLPPNEHVADHQSPHLPEHVDVVIIGSGITGTSVAWHLLKNTTSPLRIAMLEARQACSGATGRNGGHIRPAPYEEYAQAKEIFSNREAAKITTLRVAHVEALISAAAELPEDGFLAAEARVVDSIDAFFDDEQWSSAKEQLRTLKREVPRLGKYLKKFEGQEARNISLLVEAVGIITGAPDIAAAIWPYRFVTHSLKMLLDDYPSFSLDTSTPVHQVSISRGDSTPYNYNVSTPRGHILAKDVVYATNSWTPHFVPGLRGRLLGARLHMSAQLGGAGLPRAGLWPDHTGNGSVSGGRAWSLYRNGLDYAVQMPRTDVIMFGGGGVDLGDGWDTIGEYDDHKNPDHILASYLGGALPNYFGYENWGPERDGNSETHPKGSYPGRTRKVWTGIEGLSTDGRPFVGRVPPSASNRTSSTGGEWAAAAYDGEGMCFAWLCGRALTQMMLSNDSKATPDWFPESFLITEERLSQKPRNRKRRILPSRVG
ncbi:hypothetical protein FGRMN_5661 [Fusarium graminum]|nr:hypothetical protein FGRMN_5661 [Fusarium graminum]